LEPEGNFLGGKSSSISADLFNSAFFTHSTEEAKVRRGFTGRKRSQPLLILGISGKRQSGQLGHRHIGSDTAERGLRCGWGRMQPGMKDSEKCSCV
jgi:hypothetical protein